MMSLQEQVFSLLVVSSAENFNSAILSMLPKANFKPMVYAKNISTAQRAIAERSFDFVIINAPLADDLGVRFAIDCSSKHNTLVLLLIANEIHTDVYNKVASHGVFTVPKPLTKQMMDTALRWMMTAKHKLAHFEKKATTVEDKMMEIRLVNKAKWLLISNEHMEEPEAHRYLEKEAMNRCIAKTTVAEEIIKKYE